jgi:hypothetical protein
MQLPLVFGSHHAMKGVFLQASALRSHSPAELERRLGYTPGRLAEGWTLLLLEEMPAPDDFELMEFAKMSAGPPGRLSVRAGKSAREILAESGGNMLQLKQKTIADHFRLSGPDRLARIAPVDDPYGLMPFPPGGGIPQWQLVRPLSFRVAITIAPGRVYFGS